MSKTPLLSFIVPAYNMEAWLATAIRSCLGQIFQDIEVIIVDDGSMDGTGDICRWFAQQDDRVHVISLKGNTGRSAARNIGNQAARSSYICPLDADDACMPKRALMALDHFRRNGRRSVMYGPYILCDAFMREMQEVRAADINVDILRTTLDMGIGHGSMAYSKEVAMEYPYPGEPFSSLGLDDWKQQVDMLLGGIEFCRTVQPLYKYRSHTSNTVAMRDMQKVREAKNGYLNEKFLQRHAI